MPIAPAISVMRRLSPTNGSPMLGSARAAVLRDELAALVVEARGAHVELLVVGADAGRPRR